ncbi:MAG: DUF308 domain-containing protein [Clostridiales bacterium]|nr:DUF308 domain-containing protein [Clostridiales bacterium]
MNENTIKNIKIGMLVTNILTLLAGVAFIAWPKESSEMFVRIIGILFLAAAVFETICFIFAKKRGIFDFISVFVAVAAAGLGIWFLINPSWLVGFFGYVFGVVIILIGIAHLHQTIFIVRYHRNIWWVSLLVAFLAIALGVFIIINPFGFADGLMIWIGIGMVIEAVFGFFNLPAIKHREI